MRPGEHPLAELERREPTSADRPAGHRRRPVRGAVHRLSRRGRARGLRRRAVACARDPRRRAIVLIAVRADFYGHCADHPELARLLGASHVLVGPMRRDELRRAIELPSERAGLEVEPELADALLADVEGRPGALPLLSTALLELWQHRDGRRLRLSAYEHAGGVQGAVARLAERAYERLEPERRASARRILLRLAGDGRRRAVVRRRVPLAELGGDGATRSSPCSPTTAWSRSARTRSRSRTRRCCASGRDCAAGSRRTRRAGGCTRTCARPRAAGPTHGRDPSELYRGARLASTLEWAAAHERRAQRHRGRLRRREPRREPTLAAPAASAGGRSRGAARAGRRGRRVALDQRARRAPRGDRGGGPAAGGARPRRGRPRPLAAARAPGRRARRHAADARQPAGGPAADARRRSACCAATATASSPSTSARTSARWPFVDTDGTLQPRRPAHAAPGWRRGDAEGAPRDPRRQRSSSDHVQFSPDGTRRRGGRGEPGARGRADAARGDKAGHRRRTASPTRCGSHPTAARCSPSSPTRASAPRSSASTRARGKPIGRGRVVSDVLVTMLVTSDGRRVVTSSPETGHGRPRRRRRCGRCGAGPSAPRAAALSPDGRTLLVGGADGSVDFLDLLQRHASGPLPEATTAPWCERRSARTERRRSPPPRTPG